MNFFLYFAFILLIFVNGCADAKKGLGIDKDIPDEFLVKKIDSISKPPNYDILPTPGTIKKITNNKEQSVQSLLDKEINNFKIQTKKNSDSQGIASIENEIIKKLND